MEPGRGRPGWAVELRVVEEVFERHAQVLRVRVAGVTIGTTAEHPFWVAGKGWVDARELTPGDRLVGMDGQQVPVQEVADAGEWATVYNFRVADHNAHKPIITLRRPGLRPRESRPHF